MPLLAYCVVEAAAALDQPSAGVGGAAVEPWQEDRLRCFFSRFQSTEQFSRLPAMEAALAFHHVLHALFQQAALISFRYPTLLEDEQALRDELRRHAPAYQEALSRLRHMVQMEVHIGESQSPPAQKPASGREYLLQRQAGAAGCAAAVEQIRAAAGSTVTEWRQRPIGQGMRCYALLPRHAIPAFQQAVQGLCRSLPQTRLSGPWPPAEFLDLKDS
jgi:hypothetical protein